MNQNKLAETGKPCDGKRAVCGTKFKRLCDGKIVECVRERGHAASHHWERDEQNSKGK